MRVISRNYNLLEGESEMIHVLTAGFLDFLLQRWKLHFARMATKKRRKTQARHDASSDSLLGLASFLMKKCFPHALCQSHIERSFQKAGSLYHIGMECEANDDCKLVLDSKCINNHCVCQNNYIRLSALVCAPSNSLFIDKYQCQLGHVRTTKNHCITFREYFLKSCENSNDYVDIKYSECSVTKKCICQTNYISLGNKKCIALIVDHMYTCNNELDWGDIWHYRCNLDK
ncbi:hypothetical protein KQX54_008184 [Cotesia glomerata]|uniref:EB domain-containing protein n=1 Tax=Cotesia glomerata TaxID=32391 RepID=A0AAV7HYD7_COTGL|nr:hypothetical protein KQX54_008184 [Cotesia glomerata]